MEQNFQTSFIPKKPRVESKAVRVQPVGFLLIFSIFLFFTMVTAAGVFYLYKTVQVKNVARIKNDLSLARNRFEPDTIVRLEKTDKRLRAAEKVLLGHIAVSPIFESLGELTMQTVRYTKFGYTLGNEQNPRMAVKMSGVSVGYRSVALQSDLFAKNKYIIDPVFSNLSLDNSGNVLFDLEFFVDPALVNYEQSLQI